MVVLRLVPWMMAAKLAVIHCTKDGSRANQPLEPVIEIDLDLPDGRRMMKFAYFKPEEFEASKEGCDVRIGQYRFTGDLHEYHITGVAEDLSAEVHIESLSWSHGARHQAISFLAPKARTIFGWTPAVPFGKATVTYRIGTEVHQATGHGLPRPQLDVPRRWRTCSTTGGGGTGR